MCPLVSHGVPRCPLMSPGVPCSRVSPLSVVPKKSPGEYPVIHHLSYPEAASANDFIPKELYSLQYGTIQDAIAFNKKSPCTILHIVHTIIVSLLDTPLLGF